MCIDTLTVLFVFYDIVGTQRAVSAKLTANLDGHGKPCPYSDSSTTSWSPFSFREGYLPSAG